VNLIVPAAIEYPESDGKPMSDNTRQFRWIQLLHGNLSILYRERADVFVGGNLSCYSEEGRPEVTTAPDVLVVIGRPKGDRRSYKQWEEGGVPLTVVFEILSPSNTVPEMVRKFAFYEECGVEEYYIYDPDSNYLQVFVRRGDILARVRKANGFVSPRMGVRFEMSEPEMTVLYPDGRRFRTVEELEVERLQAEQQARDAQQRAEKLQQRAENAEQQAKDAEQSAANVQRRAERQAELMRRVLRQQATDDELQELQQLLQSPPPAS
jgi:Uma2 family endonuclease